jgi:hypothetical protein
LADEKAGEAIAQSEEKEAIKEDAEAENNPEPEPEDKSMSYADYLVEKAAKPPLLPRTSARPTRAPAPSSPKARPSPRTTRRTSWPDPAARPSVSVPVRRRSALSLTVTVCSLLPPARVVAEEEDVVAAKVAASSVDAVVAAVNSAVARDVVAAAKVVASSVDAAVVAVRDEDVVARPVVVEAPAVVLSPVPTSPTPVPSPAWAAHRLRQSLLRPEHGTRTYLASKWMEDERMKQQAISRKGMNVGKA